MTAQVIEKRLQQAYQRHVAGDSRAAAAIYAEVLSRDPHNADAWHLSGLVAFQQRRFDDAESLIRHALHLRPDEQSFESNLAATLLETGKPVEAEKSCRRILRTDPSHLDAMRHLGTALRKQRRTDEAAEVCEAVVRTQPADVDALCNLGAVLADLGRIDDAHRTLLKARSLNTHLPQIHLNLGAVQRQLGRYDDAMVSLDMASRLAPDMAEAATNRGNLLMEMGRPDEAIAEFERALTLNPRSLMALSGMGQALQILGHWMEAMEAFRLACVCDETASDGNPGDELTTGSPVRRRLVSNMLYCATLAPQLDRSDVYSLHRSWGQAIENAVPARAFKGKRDPEKRLRIGYLSPDFRSHATMKFFLPFVTHHDRGQVDIFCFAETVRVDSTTRSVMQSVDGWRTTNGRSDSQLADMIQQDEIDILVDLAGHTAGNRLAALAAKPAPVQVSFLGYPGTTGLSRIDYVLTDRVREDSRSAGFFSEQLVLMPNGACCFDAGSAVADSGVPPVLSNGYLTLGSTHRLEKLSPQCLQVWARVMQEIPDARLLVIRDVLGSSERMRSNFLLQLQASGIDTTRVDLSWDVPSEHLQIYSRIDILLDVFPWPSGTTAYEAMWMGVPVPAIGGNAVRSRQTSSFLNFVGIPQLVGSTEDEYVQVVADLSLRIGELCEMRRTLRDRMRATVCNGRQFARDIELIFRQMWRRYCGVPVDEKLFQLLAAEESYQR